jgi:hypothetical protein
VGWTFLPFTNESAHVARNTRSGRWTRRSPSRAGRKQITISIQNILLLNDTPPVVHQPAERCPKLSTVPTRDGWPYPEALVSCVARLTGLPTAQWHIKRLLNLAHVHMLMVQLPRGAPRFLDDMAQHNARSQEHKNRVLQETSSELAHTGQPAACGHSDEGDPEWRGGPEDRDKERDGHIDARGKETGGLMARWVAPSKRSRAALISRAVSFDP